MSRKTKFSFVEGEGIHLFGQELYCKSPAALQVALAALNEIGYIVEDLRLKPWIGIEEVQQLENSSSHLWSAKPDATDWAKCLSCQGRIDERSVATHNHQCELCGEITYHSMPKDGVVQFRFIKGADGRHPSTTMRIIHWDDQGGWLYLDPQPAHADPIMRLNMQVYLDMNCDKWSISEWNGQEAIKVRYQKVSFNEASAHTIEIISNPAPYCNFRNIRVWQDKEYDICKYIYRAPYSAILSHL